VDQVGYDLYEQVSTSNFVQVKRKNSNHFTKKVKTKISFSLNFIACSDLLFFSYFDKKCIKKYNFIFMIVFMFLSSF